MHLKNLMDPKERDYLKKENKVDAWNENASTVENYIITNKAAVCSSSGMAGLIFFAHHVLTFMGNSWCSQLAIGKSENIIGGLQQARWSKSANWAQLWMHLSN